MAVLAREARNTDWGNRMSQQGVEGLRAERADTLALLRSLSDDEWNAPSGCEGWAVRDVVAHMGSILHGVVDPTKMPDVSGGTENAMEVPVAERREWTTAAVLEEYESFSDQAANVFGMAQDPPMADTMLPMGDLGTHPMSMLASTFCFDNYTHLRHDILQPRGAIDRPEPPRDATRVAATLEWMLAGLPWMSEASLRVLDRPVGLVITGPGGGTWTLAPGGDDGRIAVTEGAAADAAATITTDGHDFVAWGTHRRPWAECVQVEGDEPYAATILDAIHVF
jgi:uncharacterized protein (TIGR03083 family)